MPPEVEQGRLELQGPWTDLYALGVVAWELAHGSPPLRGSDGTPTWTRPRFALPEGWVAWVSSLLRPVPDQRVRSAAAAWEALREVGPTPEHLAPPRGWRRLPASASHRRPSSPLAGLRSPEIVGRHVEQERLWSALEAVRGDGRPRVAVVEGPAGIGKTRLLDALAVRAAEAGLARVVRVSFGVGADPATALMVGLLRLQDVAAYRRRDALRRALARRVDPADVERVLELIEAGDTRFATARVVSELITSEAASEPLVLLLDDVDDELAALHLGRSIQLGIVEGPVLAVLAARSELALEGAEHLVLGPLRESEAGQGLVHRDLKPANVLWSGPDDERSGLKLADFGVAHFMGGGPAMSTAGTPSYMAPEVREGHLELQGPWTDLYAL
ncbi:MAG: AAA family ATPase, partial [Myxococcales bacterium]|nr:AAA family ATPase [Myxococcales bacterium]